MSEFVWISAAFCDARHHRPFTNDIGEADRDRVVDIQRRLQAGLPLNEEDYPQAIWGSKERGATEFKALPDLFMGYGYWVVSQRCADVLRQFDLGAGHLREVPVYQKDRVTPVGDHPWYLLVFGNQKRCLLPDQPAHLYKLEEGRWLGGSAKDGDVLVTPAALAGPDLWVDPGLTRAFFLSAGLGKALKKAKCDKGFSLITAQVVA